MKKFIFVIALGAIGFTAKSQVEVMNNGNVGVKTSSPTATLDVLGTNGSTNNRNFRVLYKHGGSLTNTEFSALTHTTLAGGNEWTALFAKQGSASKAGVFDGDVTFMNGNVGIGINNPAYKLDVFGESRFKFRGQGSFGSEYGIIVGTYDAGCWNHYYPAIYGYGKRLLLGTPSDWTEATFSRFIYYNKLYQYDGPTNINLCQRFIMSDMAQIQLYEQNQAAFSTRGNSATELVEYVFNPTELQAVFPQLVSVISVSDTCDGNGDSTMLAINYTGMIPILTGAINEQQSVIVEHQERIDQQLEAIHQLQALPFQQQDAIHQLQMENVQQQAQIEILQAIAFGQELDLTQLYELQDRVETLQHDNMELRGMIYELREIVLRCCHGADWTRRDTVFIILDSNKNNRGLQIPNEAILYQNKPNPFSSNTEISYYIPAILTNAFIYVYNLQGIQVKSFSATQGLNTVTISASELPAGMYLYTLVVDDVIVDSKRMILTK